MFITRTQGLLFRSKLCPFCPRHTTINFTPVVGRAFGMTDMGFGLWAGTAVNDTSSDNALNRFEQHIIVKTGFTTEPVLLLIFFHGIHSRHCISICGSSYYAYISLRGRYLCMTQHRAEHGKVLCYYKAGGLDKFNCQTVCVFLRELVG